MLSRISETLFNNRLIKCQIVPFELTRRGAHGMHFLVDKTNVMRVMIGQTISVPFSQMAICKICKNGHRDKVLLSEIDSRQKHERWNRNLPIQKSEIRGEQRVPHAHFPFCHVGAP